jgi:hypothetical protein
MLKFLFFSISGSGAALFTSSASCGGRCQTLRATIIAGSFVQPSTPSIVLLNAHKSLFHRFSFTCCSFILSGSTSCFPIVFWEFGMSRPFFLHIRFCAALSWRLTECAQIRQTHPSSPVVSSLSSSHCWRSSGKFGLILQLPGWIYICTHYSVYYTYCCLSQPSYCPASSHCHHRRKAARARDCSETGLLNPRQRAGLSQLCAPLFLCITRISLQTAWH